MPLLRNKAPYAIGYGDHTYVRLKVSQAVVNGVLRFSFNTSLLVQSDENMKFKVYDSQTKDGRFNRKGGLTETPLLNAILNELADQLREEKIPKGTIKSIEVGALSLFITFHKERNEFWVFQNLERLVNQQIINLPT